MSRREDQQDKKPRRQSKDSSNSKRANKTVKQADKLGTPKSTPKDQKSKSKSDGKSQSIKSHLSAPQDTKSKSSSGSRRRIGTMGFADDDDDFDEFNQVVVKSLAHKSLAHKSIERNGRDMEDGQQDTQATLWNKSWMDEDDDTDFASSYEREKK